MRKVLIIVASDSSAKGEREDLSGPEAAKMMKEAGYEVTGVKVLPDDREQLADAMRECADSHAADLILTSGGTGFAQRDVTPEATLDAAEKLVPGIPEAIRADSMKYTNRACLSRATACIRKRTLIINLPGSPKAVRETLQFLIPILPHGLDILEGDAKNCAR